MTTETTNYNFSLILFGIIVDCGDLDAPENGDVVYDETLEGSVANYSCNFGYRLDGDDQRVCQGDSMWSGEMPSCIREY